MAQEQNKFTLVLLTVGLFAALFALVVKQKNMETADNEVTGGLPVGTVAPSFQAPDWIYGKNPDSEDLKGQVYVINAWGLKCVYCRKFAPVIAKAHKRFKDQGVQFFGMTADSRLVQKDLEQFLSAYEITWPNGTGAAQFMRDYEVRAIPAAWVVDRTGKIVWNFDSTGSLEDAIAEALVVK